MYIHKTPGWVRRLYPSLRWDKPDRTEKTIYLTFDDGPIPVVTDYVLKTLKSYNARATFFCVGDNIRKHPGILQNVLKADHTVANHTFHHMKGWSTENDKYFENVRLCEDQIQAFTASKKLFRPPYGRIKRSQIRHLHQEYEIVMWDVLTGDYNAMLRSDKILNAIIGATRSGSIVLFHDSIKAYPRIQHVLPAYLDHFTNKGYQFLSL